MAAQTRQIELDAHVRQLDEQLAQVLPFRNLPVPQTLTQIEVEALIESEYELWHWLQLATELQVRQLVEQAEQISTVKLLLVLVGKVEAGQLYKQLLL